MNDYGFITTESDAAKTLMQLNKNWEQSYKNISDAANAQTVATNAQAQYASETALSDYQKALSQAYTASLRRQSAIGSSALGQGFKEEMRNENRAALAEAYNTYANNLAEQQSKIAQSNAESLSNINKAASEAASQVTNALQSEAQNVVAYENAHYAYLKDLFNKYKDSPNGIMDSPFALNPLDVTKLGYSRSAGVAEKYGTDFSKYVKYVDGELVLKSQEEINQMLAADDALYQEYFDAIENWAANRADADIESWGAYLNRTNADLYEWARNANAYQVGDTGASLYRRITDRNPSAEGEKYSFTSSFAGMTDKEIDNYVNSVVMGTTAKLDKLANDVSKGSNRKRAEAIKEAYSDINKTLEDYATSLGLDASEIPQITLDESKLTTANAWQRAWNKREGESVAGTVRESAKDKQTKVNYAADLRKQYDAAIAKIKQMAKAKNSRNK